MPVGNRFHGLALQARGNQLIKLLDAIFGIDRHETISAFVIIQYGLGVLD